jgi:tape measure domain-containing protein
MSGSLNLVVRITGDAGDLKAEVIGAKREVEGLGQSGAAAGARGAQGLGAMAAASARVAATAVSFAAVGAAIMAVARAGDTANAAIARMAVATGSARQALDVYDRLYQLSLRTGVAVTEAAGAFQRFAIAAREAGASQAQILAIVQLMQQAGALAGASTQETASATLQLGQALASVRLQGDELRSILEAMPNLAAALARELGVGVGELRKMGEEGKLTSETIIPAMQRAAARMNEDFQRLPPSLERSMQVLGVATGRFLADMDRAIGLSRTLARILADVAGSLNTMRIAAGLGTPIEAAERELANRRSALIQARRDAEGAAGATVADQPDGPGLLPGLGAAAARRRERDAAAAAATLRDAEQEVRAAEIRLQQLRGNAVANAEGGDAENAQRGAENRRRQAAQEITELREQLDRRLRLRREAAADEARIANAVAAGAIPAAEGARLREAVQRQLREDEGKLGGAGRRGPDAGAQATLADLRNQLAEAERLTESLRTPREKLTEGLRDYERMLANGRISQETFNRAVAAAREEFQRTDPDLRRQGQAMEELGRLGERAFDRIGSAITESMVQGKFELRDLSRVGLAVASELTQAFLRLAVINPVKNALGLGGAGGATTLNDVIGGIGRFFGGAGGGITAADASAGGFLFHTGGVVGQGAAPARAVPAALYATAPRLHGGLAPDEMPAILRRGEGVFTEQQMARLGPAGASYSFAPTIQFSGDAGAPRDRDALLAGMRTLWLADLRAAVPGIVEASKTSLRTDVRRLGADRALGATA